MELFKLLGTIAIENDKANEAIKETGEEAKKSGGKVKDFGDEGTRTESKLSKAFTKIGSTAKVVGKAVATGLAAGTAAMGAMTVKALNLSGELEQNMGGSEAVFKEYAKDMQKTAQNAYSNMGLSTSNFLATANKMGSLFQGAGFDIKTSADMSAEAMQRAADVASIMGISIDAAMESIAGAAKGNFTMMDNLGVAMNDTNLQAYALSKGIKTATKDMEQSEKIGLAMQMFLEKTEYAAGNYARENATLAGSLGTLKSAFTNFMDGSGSVDQLMSAFSGASTVVIGNLQTLLPRLVTGLTQMMDQLIPMLPGIISEVLPGIIKGATTLLKGLVKALPKIMKSLSQALTDAFNGIPFLGELFGQLMPMLEDIFSQIMPLVMNLFNTVMPPLMQLISTLLPPLMQIIQTIMPIAVELLNMLLPPLIEIAQALLPPLLDIINMLLPLLMPIMQLLQPILNLVTQLIDPLLRIMNYILKPLIQVLSEMLNEYLKMFQPYLEWLCDFIGAVLVTAIDGILVAWLPVAEGISKGWNTIKNLFSSAPNFFSGVWSGIKNAFGSVATWFQDTFSVAWQKVKDVFSTGGKIFNGIKDGIANVFKTVVNGIISGINKVVSVPFNAINNMLKKLRDVNIAGVKPFDWVTTFNVPVIPQLAKGGVLEKGQVGLLEGNGAEAVVPLENNKKWIHAVAQDMASEFGGLGNEAVLRKLDRLIEAIMTLRIYLNGDVLVGELAPALNSELGNLSLATERGQ